jgi:hypothetical protein
MRQNSTKLLSSALMVVLLVIVATDFILLVSSPWWLDMLYHTSPVDVSRSGEYSFSIMIPTGSQSFLQVFVALSGLVLGALLLEGIRLLRNIQKGKAFCMSNAKCLFQAAWLCLGQMVLFIAKMVNGPTVLTLGCAGLFLLAAMMLFVVADLFHAAALLKEDNELTI